MPWLSSLASFLGSLLAIGVILIVHKLGPLMLHRFTSPLRFLPGPPKGHWLTGNTVSVEFEAANDASFNKWIERYGPNFSYQGLFGMYRFFTMDTRTINHVITHSDDYWKPEPIRAHLGRVVGGGVLVTETEKHRQQRRILNPAFGPVQIRELTEIFVTKAQDLRDRWTTEIGKSGSSTGARIDVLNWLSKATLDIIGLAGFGYDFDALNPLGKPNELNQAFHDVFNVPNEGPQLLLLLQTFFPIFTRIKTKSQRLNEKAQATMRRIGLEIITEKKAAIMTAAKASTKNVQRRDLHERDMLTLLMKANMAADIPESQRLTDEEVLAQVPTFIVAGHESTSTTTVWSLFALTQNPRVQQKLREELLSVTTDNPTMDELQTLPYLDMFVREVLRFYAIVPIGLRTAQRNDVIPLDGTYVDRDGVTRDSVQVCKGDMIVIPTKAIHRYKPLWGDDAEEFKPERWESPPEAISNIPGVWSHLLAFFGGTQACIGYRFSIVEQKALLFTLVRAFEFELAVPKENVDVKITFVQRPVILGQEDWNQMPLIVKPYARE